MALNIHHAFGAVCLCSSVGCGLVSGLNDYEIGPNDGAGSGAAGSGASPSAGGGGTGGGMGGGSAGGGGRFHGGLTPCQQITTMFDTLNGFTERTMGGGTVTANGALVSFLPADDSSVREAGAAAGQMHQFSDCSLIVELVDTSARSGSETIYLWAHIDAGNLFGWSITSTMFAFKVIDGNQVNFATDPTDVAPRWLALTFGAQNNVRFETSSDGMAWSTYASGTVEISDEQVRVLVGTFVDQSLGDGGTFIFDNLNLPP